MRSIFVDETIVNLGDTPAWIWVAFEPSLRAILDFYVSWRGNPIDAYLFVRRLVRKYGRVTIYTDGAGWYADACKWVGVEHIVYDHPIKNLMERINQYIKDRTESLDDLYPTRRSRHPFERILSWLFGFKFLHNLRAHEHEPGRAPVEWSPPPWIEGSEFGRILGWIISLG